MSVLSLGLNLTLQGTEHQVQCGKGAPVTHTYSWSFCKYLMHLFFLICSFIFLHVYKIFLILLFDINCFCCFDLLYLFFTAWSLIWSENSYNAGGGEDNSSLFGRAKWWPGCWCPIFYQPSASVSWPCYDVQLDRILLTISSTELTFGWKSIFYWRCYCFSKPK